MSKIVENRNDKDEPAIVVNKYTKKFKKFVAVKDVSFAVTRGSIHGFIGPNGAGKTTTIKALIGAYSIETGDIKIMGKVAGTMEAKKNIGYIPERASFPGDMNTFKYLKTMIELSGFKSKVAAVKADEIIAQLGLIKHRNRKPKDFSSGMKKKVLIAQALVLDPNVLILDEPAANLDPTARKDLFDTLRALARDENKTIFISSHILSEMQDFIDEVTLIFQGEIRYSGSVKNMSTKAEYSVTVNDEKKLLEMLTNGSYEFKKDKNTANKFDIVIDDVAKFQKELAKNNIALLAFDSNSTNVEKMYGKFAEELGTESGVEGGLT